MFRAGAYAMDITPVEFPVIVNGGMLQRTATKVVDPLHARCFVLDDGAGQIAIAVVDSCMLPRELLDEAKQMAEKATGIPSNRILISATHTHSAPAAMGCLGSDRDDRYSHFLAPRIAQGIEKAQSNLTEAEIGWAVGRDDKNVACRRWLMKPGTAPTNPFGGTTNDRAQMHPGYGNENAIKPTGPVDPLVTLLSLRTADGRPLGLLANYSMHYVGAPAVSADYFAVFVMRSPVSSGLRFPTGPLSLLFPTARAAILGVLTIASPAAISTVLASQQTLRVRPTRPTNESSTNRGCRSPWKKNCSRLRYAFPAKRKSSVPKLSSTPWQAANRRNCRRSTPVRRSSSTKCPPLAS